MGWFPAITVLALLNVGLLLAIAIAPVVRGWRLRSMRRRNHQPLTTNYQLPTTNHQPLTTNDRELCALLTRLDRQARNVLLASLDRRDVPARAEVLAMAVDRRADDRVAAVRLLGTTCDPQARLVLTGSSAIRIRSSDVSVPVRRRGRRESGTRSRSTRHLSIAFCTRSSTSRSRR